MMSQCQLVFSLELNAPLRQHVASVCVCVCVFVCVCVCVRLCVYSSFIKFTIDSINLAQYDLCRFVRLLFKRNIKRF